MGFKVGERVIVTSLDGSEEFEGKVYNHNDFREPGMEYAVHLDKFDQIVFVGEKQLKKFEEAK